MKDTFQLVNVKDGRQDFAEIYNTLKEIKEGRLKNDVRLVNYYHEVPISYPVTFGPVEKDTVEFEVNQAQAVVLGEQKQVLVKSSAFPQGLAAHAIVEFVNTKNSITVLGRFAYASIRAERRTSVRVTIEGRLMAEYAADDQSLSGRLRDISLTGCALLSSASRPAGISEDGVLRLNLEGVAIAVAAHLVNSVHIDDGYMHTFQLELDKTADKYVSQFIYNRQVDIIRTIKEQFS